MFPVIKKIDEVTRWIKNKPEFVVNDKGDYSVVKYNVVMEDTFGGNDKGAKMRAECRGICFDKNGDILSRPYHKFFNLNEKAWTKAEKIDWSKPHVVMNKLDGSMIHPICVDNVIRLATKAGVTDTSINAEKFVYLKDNYYQFMTECICGGYTPIFEWLSPKNKIVLKYEENLILTGIRHNLTGDYVPYSTMKDFSDIWDIPLVEKFDSISDIKTFIESIENVEDLEGFVVRFDDGLFVKIKLPWYVLRHRSKEIIDRPIDIIRMYLDGTIDDLKGIVVDEEDRKKIDDVVSDLEAHIIWLETMLNGYYMNHVMPRFKTKKDYAISDMAKNSADYQRSYVFAMMDKRDSKEFVFNFLKGKTKSIKMWDEYRNN